MNKQNTYWSEVIVRTNNSSVDFILKIIELDVIPQCLNYPNSTLFFDAQDITFKESERKR